MIQIDGPRRRVYINFVYKKRMRAILEYRHETGELTTVIVEEAEMGVRRIRIPNFPPEISGITLRGALSKFGDIKKITEELWSRSFRYPVSNGIRIGSIGLKQHIPSHLGIAEHRFLVSYEGQRSTCYALHITTTEATRS